MITQLKKSLPLILLCTVMSANVFALEQKITCSPAKVAVKNRIYVLNKAYKAKQAKIFLIENKSDKVILIDHPQSSDAHAGAGWGTNLQPGNWSALMLAKHDFAISCAIVAGDKTMALDCGKVIKVCEANVKPKAIETSSYWLVEDKSWSELEKDVLARLKE